MFPGLGNVFLGTKKDFLLFKKICGNLISVFESMSEFLVRGSKL